MYKYLIVALFIPLSLRAQDSDWWTRPDTISDDDNIQRFIVSSPDSFLVEMRGIGPGCDYAMDDSYAKRFGPSDSVIIKVDIKNGSYRVNGLPMVPTETRGCVYENYIIGFWDFVPNGNSCGDFGKSVGFFVLKNSGKNDSTVIENKNIPWNMQERKYKYEMARSIEENKIKMMEEMGYKLPVIESPKLRIKVIPIPDLENKKR
jgi:hypothetical protein